jgi:hypothetical protein
MGAKKTSDTNVEVGDPQAIRATSDDKIRGIGSPLPSILRYRSPGLRAMSQMCQMLTLGAGVSGGPSIRISLMSTGPSKRGKPSPPYSQKKLKR